MEEHYLNARSNLYLFLPRFHSWNWTNGGNISKVICREKSKRGKNSTSTMEMKIEIRILLYQIIVILDF